VTGLLELGEMAPNFTLKNQRDEDIQLKTLSDAGKRVLLSFHPLAWTGVCEIQMRCLEAKYSAFEKLDTVALGISVDSAACKKEWAKAIGMERTSILADFWPHGHVAKMYNLFHEDLGISGRAAVVTGKEGKIIFIKQYEIPEIPDIEEIIRFLKQ
jgi:peroxiredoxin